jgi:hypothetical protein
MKKLWNGILNVLDWLTRDTPGLLDARYETKVVHLARVRQALLNLR